MSRKYEVLKLLDTGGMAEVYLGRSIGAEGFKKQVVIKKIHPHLARNQQFIRMFIEEAKLSSYLNHTNIVQIIDLGIADDNYFLVMEYIDGRNLQDFIDLSSQREVKISVAEGIFMICEVLKGLGYAHACRDDEGRPMDIVHRDVSPANVLLSYQGEVKLTDFGIAKARSGFSHTEPGVIKGKVSYMSPEQAQGLDLDHRSDLFSVGILLFEILTSRPLFPGKGYVEILNKVCTAEIPLLTVVRSDIPEGLSRIGARALSRDRELRYQSAQEFLDDLLDYQVQHWIKITPAALSQRMGSLFAPPFSHDALSPIGEIALPDATVVPPPAKPDSPVTVSLNSPFFDTPYQRRVEQEQDSDLMSLDPNLKPLKLEDPPVEPLSEGTLISPSIKDTTSPMVQASQVPPQPSSKPREVVMAQVQLPQHLDGAMAGPEPLRSEIPVPDLGVPPMMEAESQMLEPPEPDQGVPPAVKGPSTPPTPAYLSGRPADASGVPSGPSGPPAQSADYPTAPGEAPTVGLKRAPRAARKQVQATELSMEPVVPTEEEKAAARAAARRPGRFVLIAFLSFLGISCLMVLWHAFTNPVQDALKATPPDSMSISTIPPGAKVYVNSTLVGKTPVKYLHKLKNVRNWIRISKEGYQVYEKLVKMGPQGRVIIILRLKPLPDKPGAASRLNP